MIHNEAELAQAHAAVGDLLRALAALRQEYGSSSPQSFALLAEGPLEELRRIRSDIDAYAGIALAEQEQAPLWMRLVGPKARWGETPASVISAFLDALRKGVQSVAAYKVTGKTSGRPPVDVQLACDIEVAAFAAGSFEVGVRLPIPYQGDLFPRHYTQVAQEALKEFLSASAWASRVVYAPVAIDPSLEDPVTRRVVLRALKPLIPRRHGGIDFLELYGSIVPKENPIHLSPDSVDRVAEALQSSVAEDEESHEGDIREMDLDRQSFWLRNVLDIGEVPCRFGDELAPTAVELLGKRVRVIGKRRRTSIGRPASLVVIDLEKVELKKRP